MEIRDYELEEKYKAKIFEIISLGFPLFFDIYEYAENKLIIAISSDFCYYHNCEFIMDGIELIHCEAMWSTDFNLDYLRIFKFQKNKQDFIRLEILSDCGILFRFIGKSLDFNPYMVFYYERENLKPGERVVSKLF